MKIRTKLLISTSISLALMIILGLMIYTTSQEINKSVARRTLSQNIITGVFDLSTLKSEYLLNPGERSKIQWFLKYESLGNNIKKAEEEEEWGNVLKDIHLNQHDLKPLFSDFVNYTENPGGKSPELGNILGGQMLIKSQEMVSTAKRMSSLAAARVLSSTKKMSYIIIAVIAVSIIITINFLYIFKVIVNPIHQLHQATEELEKENFKARVEIKTNDELGQLGKSFNKTVVSLEKLDEQRKQLDLSKKRFLAVSSHELRSPMTPMKANLQMLLQNYFGELNKKQKDVLETVLSNTNRLDNIIVDLLEVSRINAGGLRINSVKTDLRKEIKNIVEEMTHYLSEKKIEIVSDIGKLPPIETDPDLIKQVFRNLIDNAKKFSPPKSKVLVSAELKGKVVQFTVKDQGIGIVLESQKKIFTPFFQAEQTVYREYKGNGLGLSICKGIVEALGGKIWFESEAGKGSTFYVTIPIKKVESKNRDYINTPKKE